MTLGRGTSRLPAPCPSPRRGSAVTWLRERSLCASRLHASVNFKPSLRTPKPTGLCVHLPPHLSHTGVVRFRTSILTLISIHPTVVHKRTQHTSPG